MSYIHLKNLYHCVPAYGGFICKCSLTHVAHVRLLSRVDSLVSLKGIELSKLLITVLTMIWPFTWTERGQYIVALSLSD